MVVAMMVVEVVVDMMVVVVVAMMKVVVVVMTVVAMMVVAVVAMMAVVAAVMVVVVAVMVVVVVVTKVCSYIWTLSIFIAIMQLLVYTSAFLYVYYSVIMSIFCFKCNQCKNVVPPVLATT